MPGVWAVEFLLESCLLDFHDAGAVYRGGCL